MRSTLLVTFGLALLACGDSGSAGAGGAAEGGSVPDGGAGGGGGADGGGAEGGGGNAACAEGPAVPDMPACEACQNMQCCTTADNCGENGECLAIQACLDAGTDLSACYDQHPDGVWDFSGVVICRKNHCAEECGIAAAECGGIVPTPASCLPAIKRACCAQTTTCGENDDCVALIYQCFDENQCANQACLDDCYAQYPNGVADFEAMADCWADVTCL